MKKSFKNVTIEWLPYNQWFWSIGFTYDVSEADIKTYSLTLKRFKIVIFKRAAK